jgi:hypothetical protein
VTLSPSSSSSSQSQDNHVNESQSIRLDDAISLPAARASKSEISDLWNRIPPLSSIKVVDTSQIKYTDNGSNDDGHEVNNAKNNVGYNSCVIISLLISATPQAHACNCRRMESRI